jgi:hypothetical protein
MAVDLALITYYDEVLRDVERTIVHTARHHDAHPRPLVPTVPGIGTRLSLVLLDDSHDVHRCPRGQECVASCRLVTGARESAGQRSGTSGTKSGHAHLKWAFAEAAVLFLSAHPAAQPYLARWENKHDQGTARTIRAPQWARAVYHLLPRQGAFERAMVFPREGRGADEPGAALDTQGRNLQKALACAVCTASVNTKAPRRSRAPEPCALIGPPLSLLCVAALGANGLRGRLLTRAWVSLDNATR